MAITTSPAYHLALWLLFFVVAFGWSWYFRLAQPRFAFALPHVSVITSRRGQTYTRVITLRAGHYSVIGKHTRAQGLHLITYGWLREQTK